MERTESEIIEMLREEVGHNGARHTAKAIGIAHPMVSMVLRGETGVGLAIPRYFGFEKVVVYRPAPTT